MASGEFERIYSDYFRDVYKYALCLCKDAALAEEVTQQTFFQALEHLDEFDGRCRLYVWLCQIAKNCYFTHLRKKKRFSHSPPPEAGGGDPEEGLLLSESADEVYAVLHRLEEPYKEVFYLRHFGELPFVKIGQLFGKTESWARVTYHRARRKIKEELT